MSYDHALILYQTITPLHVGCGQEAGVVDLPVIRERITGYPFIPGSGIRGALRSLFEAREPRAAAGPQPEPTGGEAGTEGGARRPPRQVDRLFGPAADDGGEPRYAGCVAVHDAKLLLFPVRSDHEVFLWITCPAVLERFAREVEVFATAGRTWRFPQPPTLGDGQLLGTFAAGEPVYLEEFRYESVAPAAGPPPGAPAEVPPQAWTASLAGLLGGADFTQRSVVVSNGSFHHFVQHATVVQQHNRLTSAKTVEAGALFSVEAVPPEAVFYGFIGATRERQPVEKDASRKDAADVLAETRELCAPAAAGNTRYLQLGGDEGTGLGVTRLAWGG